MDADESMQNDDIAATDPESGEGEMNPMNDPEERKYIYAVLNSFYRYRDQAHYYFTHKRRQSFYAMPQAHWQLLSKAPFNILATLSAVDDAIDKNAELAEAILHSGLVYAELEPLESNNLSTFISASQNGGKNKPEWQLSPTPHNQEKAHSTLRQFYREWSTAGSSERTACYTPVLQALEAEYAPLSLAKKGHIRILVPGAGLGRLVFEICRAGYAVEGNEISYHQILASNYILNFSKKAEEWELFPFVHEFSNHLTREDQFQRILVPDVHPGTELAKAWEEQVARLQPPEEHSHLPKPELEGEEPVHPFNRLSYSSADFCIVYAEHQNRGTFDAVTSVFFIDTAPNVIRYIEAVYNCLKTGGIWINLGPLKWHFDGGQKAGGEEGKEKTATEMRDTGIAEPGSVELTEEEIVLLVEEFGFKIEKHEMRMGETGYIGNQRSMWHGVYRPSFWVARKLEKRKRSKIESGKERREM